MLKIQSYTDADRDEIIALVLHHQNDHTRPPVTIADQPELLKIKEKYIESGGDFWVAKEDGKLVGCLGLMPIENDIAVLKKFFVYEAYQGAPHHLGRRLYAELIAFAKSKGIKKIVLDTPKNTERAHRFYEKAGFQLIEKNELPIRYDYLYEESDFFCLDL